MNELRGGYLNNTLTFPSAWIPFHVEWGPGVLEKVGLAEGGHKDYEKMMDNKSGSQVPVQRIDLSFLSRGAFALGIRRK